MVIPNDQGIKDKVFYMSHDSCIAGHPGRSKTKDLVARSYWWPGLYRDTVHYVSQCDSCQRIKADSQKPKGLLQPLPIPGKAWEEVTMDLITDLPLAQDGSDSIFVYTDKLTKMIHLAPTKKASDAVAAAKFFFGNGVGTSRDA